MVLRHTFLKYKLICLYAVLIVLITIPVEAQIDERVYDNFRTFVSWSPDGITLAVRSEDSVQIIDVTSMEILNTFPVNFQATVSAWSPDGSMIAIPNETQVEIWQNPQNAQLSQRIHVVGDTIPGIINFIDWSPTGDYLAIAKARIHIWRVGTNGIPHNLTDFRDTVTGFEWSPDGTLFAASSCDGTVKVWDATDFTLMHTISAISDANQVPEEIFQAVLSISWDTAGNRLAIGLQDGSTRIITMAGLSQKAVSSRFDDNVFQFQSTRPIYSVDWDFTNNQIVSVSDDGRFVIWDPETGNNLETFQIDAAKRYVQWSPYGGRLAYGTTTSITDTNRLQVITPLPSFDRLQNILNACIRDTIVPAHEVMDLTVRSVTESTLSDFIAQVESLPEDAIPLACRADLLAVAEALQALE